ncbi:MAG: hypothetical protein PHW63_06605 [Alphaproteobacteria bacterium]|nr:hypothetical protein [Alphaproteobacteria bacterium]
MPKSFSAAAPRPASMDHFTHMLAVIDGATKKQPAPKPRKTTVSPTELLVLRAQKQPWLGPLLSLLEKNSLAITAFQNRQLNAAAVLRLTLRPDRQTGKQPFFIDVNDKGYFACSCAQDPLPSITPADRKLAAALASISEYVSNLPQILAIATETGTALPTAHTLYRDPWALFLVRSVLNPRKNRPRKPVLHTVTVGPDMLRLVVASQAVCRCGSWTTQTAPTASICVSRAGNTQPCVLFPPACGPVSPNQRESVKRIYAPLFEHASFSASALGLVLPCFEEARNPQRAKRAALSRLCFIKPLSSLAKQGVRILDAVPGPDRLALHVVQKTADDAPFSGIIEISRTGRLSCADIQSGEERLHEVLTAAQSAEQQGTAPIGSIHTFLGGRPAFGAFNSLNSGSARECARLER